MKKKHPILGVICLAVLVCGGPYVFRAGAAKAEITIGGKTYEMLTLSVREFMGDDYIFSTTQRGSLCALMTTAAR